MPAQGGSGSSGSSGLAATYAAIQSAAFELFVDKGYARVTPDEIAGAAGVSVRTFYRYFSEGKEGVVLSQGRAEVEDLVDALRARPPQESALVALRCAVLEVVAEWNSSTPELSNPSLEVTTVVYSQIAAQDGVLLARLIGERILLLEPVVEQLALRLAVNPEVDVRPRLMAHAANAAITAAWFTTRLDPETDWLDLVTRSLDALERGFAGRPSGASSRADGQANLRAS